MPASAAGERDDAAAVVVTSRKKVGWSGRFYTGKVLKGAALAPGHVRQKLHHPL